MSTLKNNSLYLQCLSLNFFLLLNRIQVLVVRCAKCNLSGPLFCLHLNEEELSSSSSDSGRPLGLTASYSNFKVILLETWLKLLGIIKLMGISQSLFKFPICPITALRRPLSLLCPIFHSADYSYSTLLLLWVLLP